MTQVEIQSPSSEYLGAMKSVRLAKTIAWLVIFLALAAHATTYVLAICTNVLEAPNTALPAPNTQPGSTAARVSTSGPAAAPALAVDYPRVAGWLLPLTKFAGLVAALAMVVLLLAATQISLAGQLGGAQGFSSAFVWSLVLFLTLVPWQQVIGGLLGAGILADFNELQAAAATAKADWGKFSSGPFIAYVCRFFVWPFIALLVWIILGLRFAQGMRKVREANSVVPPEQG